MKVIAQVQVNPVPALKPLDQKPFTIADVAIVLTLLAALATFIGLIITITIKANELVTTVRSLELRLNSAFDTIEKNHKELEQDINELRLWAMKKGFQPRLRV